MQTDPTDPGQGSGDAGTGDPGTPTPPAADQTALIEQLKQENAKLREDKRTERARALGAEHKLTPTEVELLGLVKADEMEDKAKALASERGSTPAPTPTPPAGGDPPAQGDPAPASDAPPADPSLQQFDGQPPGSPIGDPSLSWQDELQERINKAETLEEIREIQEDFKQRQRAGSAPGQPSQT